MTTSIEEYAAMRLAWESTECLCDEYAVTVVNQAMEIKELKEKIDNIEDQLENLFNMG